ncbi:MAG: hypothetical protein GY749_24170 [Desulfobacteraceae bacterium]|nr:hypothetical protein [Desulfobacteraceae bacterium]
MKSTLKSVFLNRGISCFRTHEIWYIYFWKSPDTWEMKHFGTLDKDGTGDADQDGISDLDEYLNGTEPVAGQAEHILGDADGDGEIDIFDALLIAEYSAGLWNERLDLLIPDFQTVADIDGNGTVDINDALEIARYDVGLGSEYLEDTDLVVKADTGLD